MRPLPYQCRFSPWALICFLGLAGLVNAAAQDFDDDRQYVLLRNGRVLQGTLRQSLDNWILRFDSGASLKLTFRDIDLLGNSLQHLYAQMQQRTQREQTEERVEIIEFCLRHQLLSEAQNEVAWLKQDGVPIEVWHRLEIRLSAARKQARLESERSLVDSKTPERTPRQNSGPDSEVLAAEYQAEMTGNPDDPWGSVNDDDFSMFVREVQPHLLMGCSQALCHGAQGLTGFVFERQELGAAPTRKMSQANYSMVKRWIDKIGTEKLTQIAQSVHGGMRKPVWESDSVGTNALNVWAEYRSEHVNGNREAGSSEIRRVGLQQGAEDSPQQSKVDETSPYDPEIFHRFVREQADDGPAETATDSEVKSIPERIQSPNEGPSGIKSPPRSRSRNE
jgi:hypothetical protein